MFSGNRKSPSVRWKGIEPAWVRPHFRCFLLLALLLGVDFCNAQSALADIVWEDHFSDEATVDGSSFTTSTGAKVNIGTSVYSDSDGGTYDLALYNGNSDYITFESGQLGAHNGYIEMAFDNENDDWADYVEITLTFDRYIENLEFSLLDIDSGTWDDGIEVYYNAERNARDNGTISVTTNSTNGVDNESYMHGWEGYGSNAASNQTIGNMDFDFGSLRINYLRIRYFSTDDADNNPGGQLGGISDMTFTNAVPEARSTALLMVFCLLTGMWQGGSTLRKRRESRRTDQAIDSITFGLTRITAG
ncbi:MAG: hypothetical protein KDA93_15385 [Planctomycetaceae bacterium]|nr:hypothetical protein [Planctomycetaceae bacterium]